MTTPLTVRQRARASGAVLASACGSALGAPLRFGAPSPADHPVAMTGGGLAGLAPGEWTSTWSTTVPVLRAVATGRDLLASATQDELVAAWSASGHTADRGRSAGNGSLVRTGPVALAHLGPDSAPRLAEAARALSDLTHDADAGDTCVLWSLAIRHAILTGELHIRVGLDALPAERRARWTAVIEEAEREQPSSFTANFSAIRAFQGAWSAISRTRLGRGYPTHLLRAVERAVRGGNDTDSVAAIAGSLLGARYGVADVPAAWRHVVHGRPGLRGDDLVPLARRAVAGGREEDVRSGGPAALESRPGGVVARHPHDPDVWLSGDGPLAPHLYDAVTGLVTSSNGVTGNAERVGRTSRFDPADIDRGGTGDDVDLVLVLTDAADAIASLRASGNTVHVRSEPNLVRTPAIAALYSAWHLGIPREQAERDVEDALVRAYRERILHDVRAHLSASRTTPTSRPSASPHHS